MSTCTTTVDALAHTCELANDRDGPFGAWKVFLLVAVDGLLQDEQGDHEHQD